MLGKQVLDQHKVSVPGHKSAITSLHCAADGRRLAAVTKFGECGIWELDTDDLPDTVAYEPDPGAHPTHGLLEPAWSMTLEDFELALAETRDSWRKL